MFLIYFMECEQPVHFDEGQELIFSMQNCLKSKLTEFYAEVQKNRLSQYQKCLERHDDYVAKMIKGVKFLNQS